MFKRKAPPTPTETPVMLAVEIRREQGSASLAMTQCPRPIAGPDELLIRVAYAGVNRADLMQRDGHYPPPAGASPLPGLEVSGTIAALGPGVIGWNIGEPVCALLAGGGYAEYVVVPASQVLAVPNRISLDAAACLPEAAATAVMALGQEAQLKPRERVLLHGGTSGLGIILAQIARCWGAEVYATVGSDEKRSFLAPFGITAINHRAAPFAEQITQLTDGQGVDVIIDTLGGPQLGTHLGLLRRGGRMVSLALMEGAFAESLKVARMVTHRLRWSGTTLRSQSLREKAEIMALVRGHVWPHVATGAIRPVIDQVFPLAEAEKALARMQERLHLGKILLEIAPETKRD